MRLGTLLASVFGIILLTVDPAWAAEGEAVGGGASLGALAAGLAIGVAAFGGALGQGKVISAALESIGRNPGASGQMFLPWILGLVFIESLVIYALIIAFQLS